MFRAIFRDVLRPGNLNFLRQLGRVVAILRREFENRNIRRRLVLATVSLERGGEEPLGKVVGGNPIRDRRPALDPIAKEFHPQTQIGKPRC